MRYEVRAAPREGHDGRNRDGRRFLVEHPTLLEEHELTEGIRQDRLLIVTPILPEATRADAPTCEECARLRAALEQLRSGETETLVLPSTLTVETGEAGWGDLSRLADLGTVSQVESPASTTETGEAAPDPDPEPHRCGAPTSSGPPCRAVVREAGERCHAHPAES